MIWIFPRRCGKWLKFIGVVRLVFLDDRFVVFLVEKRIHSGANNVRAIMPILVSDTILQRGSSFFGSLQSVKTKAAQRFYV